MNIGDIAIVRTYLKKVGVCIGAKPEEQEYIRAHADSLDTRNTYGTVLILGPLTQEIVQQLMQMQAAGGLQKLVLHNE